jgi:hypothetical protein
MLNNDANPNTLSRLELLKLAQTLRVSDADVMTRAELRAAIERAKRPEQRPPAQPVTWLGVARRLLASIVEQGLHLPDAAAVIRGNPALRPIPSGPPPVATVTLARIYASQGHLERAISTLDEVLKSDPDHDLARELRGQLRTNLEARREQERREREQNGAASHAAAASNGRGVPAAEPAAEESPDEPESSPASELLRAVPLPPEAPPLQVLPSREEVTLGGAEDAPTGDEITLSGTGNPPPLRAESDAAASSSSSAVSTSAVSTGAVSTSAASEAARTGDEITLSGTGNPPPPPASLADVAADEPEVDTRRTSGAPEAAPISSALPEPPSFSAALPEPRAFASEVPDLSVEPQPSSMPLLSELLVPSQPELIPATLSDPEASEPVTGAPVADDPVASAPEASAPEASAPAASEAVPSQPARVSPASEPEPRPAGLVLIETREAGIYLYWELASPSAKANGDPHWVSVVTHAPRGSRCERREQRFSVQRSTGAVRLEGLPRHAVVRAKLTRGDSVEAPPLVVAGSVWARELGALERAEARFLPDPGSDPAPLAARAAAHLANAAPLYY